MPCILRNLVWAQVGLTVALACRTAVGQGLVQPATMPSSWPPPAVWVVAKFISKEANPPPADGERCIFEVTRTLNGADVTGDKIGVATVGVSEFEPGKLYVLCLFAEGHDFSLGIKAQEATDRAVAEANKAIALSGGSVSPKLALWAACMSNGMVCTFDAQVDGKFIFLLGYPWPKEKVLLRSEGRLSKEQVADLARRFEAAKTGVVPGDAISGGGIGWRDAEDKPHQKEYVPPSDPDEVWSAIRDILIKQGSDHRDLADVLRSAAPSSPPSEPATRPSDSRKGIRR